MANTNEAFITPKFRCRWTNLAKADDKGKFNVTMLFPEGTDLRKMKKAVKIAIETQWGNKFKESQLTLPLKDGNDKVNAETGEVYAEYVDTTWATASTKFAVTPLDKRKEPIPASEVESEIYDGCWCVAQVKAYAWEYKDDKSKKVIKRGISFQLDNIMKVADDDRIGGTARQDAKSAFADVEMDEDDPSNYDDNEEL